MIFYEYANELFIDVVFLQKLVFEGDILHLECETRICSLF